MLYVHQMDAHNLFSLLSQAAIIPCECVALVVSTPRGVASAFLPIIPEFGKLQRRVGAKPAVNVLGISPC
jgi:hypothetical protein